MAQTPKEKPMNKLDLNKIESKLNTSLENETSKSLTNWLKEKRNTMDKEQLLEYCHANAKDYIYLTSQREFDCLIALVEDGDITTFEDLANYGMETKFLKNKINK